MKGSGRRRDRSDRCWTRASRASFAHSNTPEMPGWLPPSGAVRNDFGRLDSLSAVARPAVEPPTSCHMHRPAASAGGPMKGPGPSGLPAHHAECPDGVAARSSVPAAVPGFGGGRAKRQHEYEDTGAAHETGRAPGACEREWGVSQKPWHGPFSFEELGVEVWSDQTSHLPATRCNVTIDAVRPAPPPRPAGAGAPEDR